MERETDRATKTMFIACTSLTSAYAYQWGLVVRAHPAHPASIAAIILRFSTVGEVEGGGVWELVNWDR